MAERVPVGLPVRDAEPLLVDGLYELRAYEMSAALALRTERNARVLQPDISAFQQRRQELFQKHVLFKDGAPVRAPGSQGVFELQSTDEAKRAVEELEAAAAEVVTWQLERYTQAELATLSLVVADAGGGRVVNVGVRASIIAALFPLIADEPPPPSTGAIPP